MADALFRKKILIIDDDAEILEIAKTRLGAHGYKVFIANDGFEGLALARAQMPDLILLDIIMPKLDGFAVLAQLRASSHTSIVPVIMLTAKSESTSVMESQTSGATDYFIKPCDWQELLRYIKRYLD
ncbi:MAG: response regulator [Candidatus Omnitrophota bacterium]|nr:response regulator [Candidatus Omnitrophota bacterium]